MWPVILLYVLFKLLFTAVGAVIIGLIFVGMLAKAAFGSKPDAAIADKNPKLINQ
jgi:hypothetical protein